MNVIYAPKAANSIDSIRDYITEKGYPERAEKFTNSLYDFGESLALFFDKYKLCPHPELAKRMMRCAVFQKNYIFVHKQEKGELIIYNIIHARTNPQSFAA